MKDYTPKIIENRFVEMLIQGDECQTCQSLMIKKIKKSEGLFPMYHALNQESQAKNAGIQFIGNIKVDDEYICEKCEKEGKADFLCALCEERKSTDKIQEIIGDPAEFLCTDCYNTVPASIWTNKLKELLEDHQYDYE